MDFNKIIKSETEAAEFGFKWETHDQIISQIRSEINEVEVHLKDRNQVKLQEEIGDLLHAVFSLCVFCKLDPETTLQNSIDKFVRRFNIIKTLAQEEGLDNLQNQSFEKLMGFWERAKKIADTKPTASL